MQQTNQVKQVLTSPTLITLLFAIALGFESIWF